MRVIVGLGNPGRKYSKTRHNVGFMVMDVLEDKYGVAKAKEEHKGLVTQGLIDGNKVLFVKPQTYMNLSGDCVSQILSYYKLDAEEDLIVISDDIAQPAGGIRIRAKGSAGGHNGLKDIIAKCNTDKFIRVRIGVGINDERTNLVDHVLGKFDRGDRKMMAETIELAAEAVAEVVNVGVESAMNKYNRKAGGNNNK